MMTVANALVHWLLRRAAGRWPADQRADLMREWAGEVSTIAQDPSTRAIIRQWHMLAFGGSLALSPGVGQYAPFGMKRIAAVMGALSMYLLGLTVLQYGWFAVYQVQGEGERPIIDDAGLPARLVVGAVALVPVVVATLGGWLTGGRSNRQVRPMSLGLCLIAVVAAWVGIGFLQLGVTMGYSFGNQPYGMVTSWVVWLLCFAAVTGFVRRAVRHRLVVGFVATITVAATAVTAGTFVQFGASTTPRTEAWKWFVQWLVPPDPFSIASDEGADSFHSARDLISFVSSYPHVLLAAAAFGVAFLLATRERVDTPPDLPQTQATA
jgi:hypothetical protein